MTHLLVWYDKSARARRRGIAVPPLGRFTITEAVDATKLDRALLTKVARGEHSPVEAGKFWIEGERK